jgi:U4/U6 small nuclear ribonucleoprotein PRP4
MSVSYDTSLKVWSTKDWGMAKKYEAHESKISSLSISNNRKYLATTSVDRKWMLWVRNENLGGSN